MDDQIPCARPSKSVKHKHHKRQTVIHFNSYHHSLCYSGSVSGLGGAEEVGSSCFVACAPKGPGSGYSAKVCTLCWFTVCGCLLLVLLSRNLQMALTYGNRLGSGWPPGSLCMVLKYRAFCVSFQVGVFKNYSEPKRSCHWTSPFSE